MSFGVMCKVCGWPKRVGKPAENTEDEACPESVPHMNCLCDRMQRPLPIDEMLMEPSSEEEE